MQSEVVAVLCSMSRGTRRQAAAATELEEEAEPSSPPQPAVSVAGLKEEFSRHTFLQSVIQKGYMQEDEARDMYIQLTDNDTGMCDCFAY